MDPSQFTSPAPDELRFIQLEARQSTSVDDLRHYFERVQTLKRSHPDDFDLQLFIAEVQEEIISRARVLHHEPAAVLVNEEPNQGARPSTPAAPGEQEEIAPPETPPATPQREGKIWQRATYLALFLTVILFALFFYLVQTARKLNFTPAGNTQQTSQQNTSDAAAKNQLPQTPTNTPEPAPANPTLRLYTDLVPATVAIDGNPPQDLKDGELVLDNLVPGRHSVQVTGAVNGHPGNAAFSFDVAENSAPRVIGLPSASNAMAVLVSAQGGNGRLVTNAQNSQILLDGKPAGQVGVDGLSLENLGTADHDLQVTQDKDRQRFVLTYTAAPALTAYVKSDPNAGTVVVMAGQDGADVYVNGKPYRRKTERGQLRIPDLGVGDYVLRVHKEGFVDPPPETVEVKKGEESAVAFRLDPIPALATLEVKGALTGTNVFVDNQLAATVGPDGNASIPSVKPGDHTVELRRDQALTKRFQRTFRAGDVIVLSGPDVTLDQLVAENKPARPAPAPAPAAASNSIDIAGEQVRKGGGFVPYHVPRAPGHYTFLAQARKSGLFHRGKLQWYAAYEDGDNYVLFTLDGKHASVREVRDGKSTEVNRIPFSLSSDDWVQVDLAVKPDSIDARVKTPDGEWNELGPISSAGHDFTEGKVGFYIPGNDEIAVSNFRFSAH